LALKVAGEQEVKAQVKLKFHNTNGQEVVCTRSLQLTQKKNKLEQKTLEGLLLIKENGEVRKKILFYVVLIVFMFC